LKSDDEVIVLGLGGIGVGAAYWLAQRAGGEVLGLEQFQSMSRCISSCTAPVSHFLSHSLSHFL
jgi:glycine/D-amino acid oxidase-like deaminating enzyme